jgi:hypothetical protein
VQQKNAAAVKPFMKAILSSTAPHSLVGRVAVSTLPPQAVVGFP